MPSDQESPAADAAAPAALEQALQQSHEVKAKVEEVVDDLATTNEAVKRKIADGATMLPAQQTLEDSQTVETQVQECVDDLHSVTESLVKGIDDLKRIEAALNRSREALAESETQLTASHAEERKSTLRALHDSATGLPNRKLFDDRLTHAVALAERHDWTLAVMFLDLDRFKSINDEHGHAAGDLVLKEVAQRLSQNAREEDTVCRNGGDEFLYLLMNPQGNVNITRVARSVVDNLARPIDVGGGVVLAIRASIGIAVYPDDGATGEVLIKNADAAMYRAKKHTRAYAFHGCEPASATA